MIPVFDVTRQNKILSKELDAAIKGVVDRGTFILGPKVKEFEREFAKYLGVKYSIGVASGTDAISLALLAIGVKQGDEVIMPANAYPSVFAVTEIGAVPKLVDIDPATYNIDPAKIEEVLSAKTKAILPVHLYGQPAQMEKILEIGKKHNIPVVEDCAQAVGSSIKYQVSSIKYGKNNIPNTKYVIRNTREQKVGSIGDAGCFSFYPTKNLGAFGDGGMVVTNNREIYEKVKLLRMYGEKERYNSIVLGRNSRLDELQAAILLVKLKYLEKWNKRRREIARYYIAQLLNCSIAQSKVNNGTMGQWDNKHVYHLFVIRSKKRDELKKYLEEKGIQTAIHYPVPIHLVPSMKYFGYKKGDFPEAEIACEEILSLPIFPELTNEEVKLISSTIKEFLS